MKYFDEVSLRLKETLKVMEDKELAKLFGMKKTAWAERKQRDKFPVMTLCSYADMHPELNLDINYILHGRSLLTDITSEELNLLNHFRSCSDKIKKQVLQLLENGFKTPEEF